MNMENDDIKDLQEEPGANSEGLSESPDQAKAWEIDEEWRGAADSALKILSDDDDDEEFDDLEELEEGQTATIRTILITGACGNIARKLRDAWEDIYDLVLIDAVVDDNDPDVIQADLSVWDQNWVDLFADVDTVIHLAGNRDEFSAWHELAAPNIDAFANVLNAAILNEVERFIYASSNHVMGGYRDIEEIPITSDLPPKPDSPYGGTKLMGERLGKASADAFGMTFLAIRIGWIQDGINDPETLPDEWARMMWLSNDDMIQLFECAVEADLGDREFLIVNGMSNNSGMRWDLGPANEWLGFQPEDDAFASLDDTTDLV
ncbi:MAG: NAD(P)-dependent oxidoreductase [Planctomycetota bacterium]|nr:NAD(P)-dependent oxidoreductase [Planctomycetota bacterium]